MTNERITTTEGWWPAEDQAPVTQMFFRAGRIVATIIKCGIGWRSYSLLKLNHSGTGGMPLSNGSVVTREEAKKQVEDYAATL